MNRRPRHDTAVVLHRHYPGGRPLRPFGWEIGRYRPVVHRRSPYGRLPAYPDDILPDDSGVSQRQKRSDTFWAGQ
jgi:hypothetical protein